MPLQNTEDLKSFERIMLYFDDEVNIDELGLMWTVLLDNFFIYWREFSNSAIQEILIVIEKKKN